MVQNDAAVPLVCRYRLQQYCRRRVVSVSLSAAACLQPYYREQNITRNVMLLVVALGC